MLRLWISAKGVLLSYIDVIYILAKTSVSLFSRSLRAETKTIQDLTYLTVYYFNQTL